MLTTFLSLVGFTGLGAGALFLTPFGAPLLAGIIGSKIGRQAIVVALIVAGLGFAWLAIRHHYVQLGFDTAIRKVERQNEAGRAVAKEVQATADQCGAANGYWDVLTQACQTETAP